MAILAVSLVAGGQAVGNEPTQKVAIKCLAAKGIATATSDALCAALVASFQQDQTGWVVAKDSMTTMDLSILSAGKRGVTAALSWQSGPESGESPALALDVTDGTLTPSLFPAFIRQLLKSADWPR